MATTEAGDRLLETLRPAFADIDAKLSVLGELRDKPAGTIRITASHHAADGILWPKIRPLLEQYPEVKVEISTDAALTDIVTDRFDAGVRLGEQVDKDMIAARIGPDVRMIVVGCPAYMAGKPLPVVPDDLTAHSCINVRLPSSGGLYAWEFGKDDREVRVRVDGQLIFNNMQLALRAALEGAGLAFVFEDMASDLIDHGNLVCMLDDWCPPFAGYHLYYPSRRQHSPAFKVVLGALQFTEDK
jgi:DNA-binding transcriptional LysR family regulator